MSIVADIGIAAGFIQNKAWRLKSLDDPNNGFTGQFQAENLTENVGQNQDQTNTLGQQVPLIQFSSGEVETITFRARIFRTSPITGAAFNALANPVGTAFSILSGNAGPLVANAAVKDQIEKIKTFSRKNDSLGRPERFLLTLGTEMEFEVFVRSPGGIQYDEIRSDGTIRGASFTMQCVKIKAENLNTEAGVSTAAKIKSVVGVITTISGGISGVNSIRRDKLINIPFGSLHTIDKFLIIKQGDTYESIARREYGNPQLGVILRRAQPGKLDLEAGQEIVTIKKREIVQINDDPTAVALRPNVETTTLLDTFLSLRGKPTVAIT